MKEEDYSKSIEVFSGSPWEAEIIKGLLESNDIRCVIKDGIMGTLAPYIAPAVSVLVTEDEYESATELIRSWATGSMLIHLIWTSTAVASRRCDAPVTECGGNLY